MPQTPSGLSFLSARSGWSRKVKRPAGGSGGPSSVQRGEQLGLADVGRLEPLRALGDLELDLVALGQALEALGLNAAVVDEHILATLHLDEAVPFRVVEPLDGALCHTSGSSLLRTSLQPPLSSPYHHGLRLPQNRRNHKSAVERREPAR